MVVGVSVCVYASAGLGVDTDKTELNATFSYNEGHTLDIEVGYTEYHSGINHHYRCVDVNTNMGSEVKYSVKVKSGYAGIDENGRVMVITKTCEMDCPLISGVTALDTEKGDFIKLEDENAKEKSEILIKLLTGLSVRSMIPQVKTINVKDTEKISLTLVTKTVVNLGHDGEENKDTLEYKIAFLKAILDEDYPKNGGIIELSDTSNVTSRVS